MNNPTLSSYRRKWIMVQIKDRYNREWNSDDMVKLPWSIDNGFYGVTYTAVQALKAAWNFVG